MTQVSDHHRVQPTTAGDFALPVVIDGYVVEGDRRGRQLGFPTANLLVPRSLVPAEGVYAGIVRRTEGGAYRSAISVGTRETFYHEGAPVLVEAHLLDFSGDLYGEVLVAELMLWLREQRRYTSVAELIDQIRRDVLATRRAVELSTTLSIGSRLSPGAPLGRGAR
jgi:riboflavin kinase/FMN adenylyltransferase